MLAAIESEPAPELPALSESELCRRAVLFATLELLLRELDPYREALVEKCKGVDVQERGRAIDEKILRSIAAAYPWLFAECRRRMANVQRGNAPRPQGRY